MSDQFSAESDSRSEATKAEHQEHQTADVSRGLRSLRWRRPPSLEAYALPIAWLVLIVVFSALEPSTFFTAANFQTILGSQSILVLLTVALTIPLIAGEFDLSIGAVMGLSAMITAWMNATLGLPLGLCVAVAMMSAVVIGFVNGVLVVTIGVNALIATLGMATLVTGVSYSTTNYLIVAGVDRALVAFASSRILGLPLSFYYTVLVTLMIWFWLRYTPSGRHLAFVGGNRDAARLTGLRVNRLRYGAFLACAILAAFAGILLTGTLGSSDPNNGPNLLLPAFAAAFLGATTIRPGHFNPWGSLVAVYFLVTGITGLQMLGLRSWIQDLFYGGALIIAVVLARASSRKRVL